MVFGPTADMPEENGRKWSIIGLGALSASPRGACFACSPNVLEFYAHPRG
jgi:hypothetical protein